MEYILYSTAVLLAVVLCIYKIVALGRPARLQKARRARNAKEAQQAMLRQGGEAELDQSDEVRQRELLKVPTPWGWPGNHMAHQTHYIHTAKHSPEHAEETAPLHRWVDHLVSSKQTTSDEEYLRRREASMRALLEDRFVSPKQMTKVEYKKSKPPLLRDPSQPHDQMDNFPAGRIDKIESHLRASTGDGAGVGKRIKTISYEESPALRTPWGW